MKSAPGKLDTNGQAVQEHAVYRARVQGKIGWSLVQAVGGFDDELGFWVEGVSYLVSPDAVEIISERVLPPWPLSATARKQGAD